MNNHRQVFSSLQESDTHPHTPRDNLEFPVDLNLYIFGLLLGENPYIYIHKNSHNLPAEASASSDI